MPLGDAWFRLSAIVKYERNPVYDVKAPYNFRQTINADYDVVAEAEAILAEAALVTV